MGFVTSCGNRGSLIKKKKTQKTYIKLKSKDTKSNIISDGYQNMVPKF